MKNVNIIVMGKTGAGKSTLVNSVLKENVAPTGIGRAITKQNKIYKKKLKVKFKQREDFCQLILYDTVGLEIDKQITENTLSEVKRHILSLKQSSDLEDVSIVWFCINELSKRLESYEVDLIKKLSIEYEIPFMIVLTQNLTKGKKELEKQINSILPDVQVEKVLAKEYPIDDDNVLPEHGVNELLVKSINNYRSCKVKLLEKKIDLLDEVRKERKEKYIKEFRTKAERCIKKYSDKAETIGWLPGFCIPVVHTYCIEMICEINSIAGLSLSEVDSGEIFSDFIVGIVATPLMALPLFSVAVASSYVETVGSTYLGTLESVLENTDEKAFDNNEEMVTRIEEELRKLKK